MKCIQLCALCVCFGATISVRAEPPALSVKVRPHKASVVLGEPVVLWISMTNTGPESLELLNQGMYGYVRVYISSRNGEYTLWNNYFRSTNADGCCYEVAPYRLGPGKATEEWSTMVFCHADRGFVFSTTGTYSFVAETTVLRNTASSENVKSKPVQVTVMNPQGEDLLVWEELRKVKEYGMFAETSRCTNDESVAIMSGLIERYPTCAYAPFLRFVFANYYWDEAYRLRDPTKAVGGSHENFLECREKALRYLKQATNDWQEIALRLQIYNMTRMLPRDVVPPQNKK